MSLTLMDMTLEIVIVSASVFLAGLVFCLEIVRFGRVAIICATMALLSVFVSLGCLQLIPSVWDAASPPEPDVLSNLAQTDRLLWISQTMLATAVLSTIAFCSVGLLRVWRRRSVLVARFNSHHVGSADSSPSPDEPLRTRDRIFAVVAILVLTALMGWELFDFAVTNRGVQYYRDHPLMLLFAVGPAALVGLLLATFAQYARQHATREDSPTAPK